MYSIYFHPDNCIWCLNSYIIFVHVFYILMNQTCIAIQNSNMNLKRDWFTSICCRRGTSGLGLCALENAISSEKQGDRQVWASTYMLLVDRTWKEEKARKRWSNACARYTLQDLFLAWFTKRFGLHAILYCTPCLAWWLTNPRLALFGNGGFSKEFWRNSIPAFFADVMVRLEWRNATSRTFLWKVLLACTERLE